MLAAPAPIDLDAALPAMIRQLAPVAFHNAPRARRVRLTCQQPSARRLTCVLRGWDAHGRRVIVERINVRSSRSHRTRVFEDYSGWIRYRPTSAATPATLYLDPS
jgi:hypothetical protein